VPDRDQVARRLAELGVGTTVHYPIPIPAQPLFCPAGGEERVAAAYPEAARAAREVLSLPCFPELTDVELGEVAAAVRTVLTGDNRV
jgi:dTDP-4-amino-4,6-dideoxygalactose transaminase